MTAGREPTGDIEEAQQTGLPCPDDEWCDVQEGPCRVHAAKNVPMPSESVSPPPAPDPGATP